VFVVLLKPKTTCSVFLSSNIFVIYRLNEGSQIHVLLYV